MSDIRWGLIAHVREQIAAGTYVTQAKLEIACERLVENLQETERSKRSEDWGDQCERPSTSPRRPRTT